MEVVHRAREDVMSTAGEIFFVEPRDEVLEQFRQEEEAQVKAITAWLWRANFYRYEIMTYHGLIFISNKDKSRRKKLHWLKKYHAVLQRHGIKATVCDGPNEPYICC
jgi:hypothetical protein